MTSIRARVMKLDQSPNLHPPGHPWVADAWAIDDGRHSGLIDSGSMFAASWPEAMQAAYKQLNDLDQHLMSIVHESRAARRATQEATA